MVQQQRQASAFAVRRPLWLHLGSSSNHLDQWVNVDLVGVRADLVWDLSSPLPFKDGSVDAIFHEHVLEHFQLKDAVKLLEECYRLLVPGGVLRVGVPDAGAYLRSYMVEDPDFIERNRPHRPTRLLAIQEIFFDHGHRSAYDYETLAFMVEAAGFRAVESRAFGHSRLEPCPDSVNRKTETMYVESIR
jgi:predicted SAM-dependent methyltransferase